MKSRFFANLWLCLMLLFAQHVTLADSVTAAQYTSGDHQCALEDGSSSDADTGAHVALDDVDHGVVASFYFPLLPPASHQAEQKLVIGFFSAVSSLYSTRAPPGA
jgi:hypothetical protein